MRIFLIAFAQVIGYIFGILIIMGFLVIPTKWIFGELDSIEQRLQIFFLGIHLLLAVTLVNWVMVLISKSQLVKEGWPRIRVGVKWFGIGTIIGLLMAGGVLIITVISGGSSFTLNNDSLIEYLQYVLPLVIFLLLAALGEEWIFRGYPLTKLSPIVGKGWANILVSLLFMVGHWGGDGWSALAVLNIFIFSLVNGVMRFTRGGIPAAWGFHFAWNSLYVISGATLSGENFQVPLIQFPSDGPGWLSGGAYGPEGGLGTSIITIVGLMIIYKYLQGKIVTDTPNNY